MPSEELKVFVRVRPPISKEINLSSVVKVNDNREVLVDSEKQKVSCHYDYVFDEFSDQSAVFNRIQPLLSDVLNGYNACIFAYGQTSAGKSYTMIGPEGGQSIHKNTIDWGILPRAASYLFGELADKAQDGLLSYHVKASFLQIYNENIFDLLRENDNTKFEDSRENDNKLKIREIPKPKNRSFNKSSTNNEVYVSGLSEYRVQTCDDVMKILQVGTSNRTTRSTDYNVTSSRSHAIFQLTFDIETYGENEGETSIVRSKLSLVDLAGSEKMQISDNADITNGKHIKELTSINKSLSCLGNVISALTKKTRTHIPYRESKLTRLLQDSLGGNTRTVVIACIAPSVLHTSETVNTLHFADRAKSVILRVKANAVTSDRVLLSQARVEIERLKSLLKQALQRNEDGNTNGNSADEIMRLTIENETLKQENISLRKRLKDFEMGKTSKLHKSSDDLTGNHLKSGSLVDSIREIQSNQNEGTIFPPIPTKFSQRLRGHIDASNVLNDPSEPTMPSGFKVGSGTRMIPVISSQNNNDTDVNISTQRVPSRSKSRKGLRYDNAKYDDKHRQSNSEPNLRQEEEEIMRDTGYKPSNALRKSGLRKLESGQKKKRLLLLKAMKENGEKKFNAHNSDDNSGSKSKLEMLRRKDKRLQDASHEMMKSLNHEESVLQNIQQMRRALEEELYKQQKQQDKSKQNPVESMTNITLGRIDTRSMMNSTVQNPSDIIKSNIQKQFITPSTNFDPLSFSINKSLTLLSSNGNNNDTDAIFPTGQSKGISLAELSQSNIRFPVVAPSNRGQSSHHIQSNDPIIPKLIPLVDNTTNSSVIMTEDEVLQRVQEAFTMINKSHDHSRPPSFDHPIDSSNNAANEKIVNNNPVTDELENELKVSHPSISQPDASSSQSTVIDDRISRSTKVIEADDNDDEESENSRPNLTCSKADIGLKLQLFSFRLNAWEIITITDYEASKSVHKVLFPSGKVQWLDLKKKPIRSLPENEILPNEE